MKANGDRLKEAYMRAGLTRADLHGNPIKQFEKWFEQACQAGIVEPNAMSLTTVSKEGAPRLRTVLLKRYDESGFVFFTNFESPKSRDIKGNPNVAALFPWIALERQVIVRGVAERASPALSQQYFQSRPRRSRLGAWASRQSSPIPTRAILEKKVAEMEERFRDGPVPLPDFWGGYRIVPHSIEFWQGRPNRLHDRFVYEKIAPTQWRIQRLSP